MAQFNLDNAVDTAGTALTSHTADTGNPWVKANGSGNSVVPTIETGGIALQETNVLHVYYLSGSPSGSDYSSTGRYFYTSGPNRPAMGVCLCQSTSANTRYELYWIANFGSPTVVLNRVVAGATTNLVSTAMALGFDTYDFSGEKDSSGIRLYIVRVSYGKYLNSSGTFVSSKTAVATSSDTSLSDGKGGFIMMTGTAGGDVTLKPFSSNDLASAPPAGTVTISDVSPSDTSATITYTYSASDQDSFEYTLNGGTSWSAIGNSPGSITGLTSYTAYTIQVRAINVFGAGTASSGTSFTTDNVGTGSIEIPLSGGGGGSSGTGRGLNIGMTLSL